MGYTIAAGGMGGAQRRTEESVEGWRSGVGSGGFDDVVGWSGGRLGLAGWIAGGEVELDDAVNTQRG